MTRWRNEFLLAWTLLVIVVAFGFFVQARTIDELHETQDRLDLAVTTEIRQTHDGSIVLCQLMLDISNGQHHQAIIEAFAKQNVDCNEPLLGP